MRNATDQDHFAFHTDATFLRVGRPHPQGRFVIAGVAWDGATTNRPGARFGPRAIRDASHMLCDGRHPLFDVSPRDHLGDAGDLSLPNTDLRGMRAAMVAPVNRLLTEGHTVWLGGDHSITLPLLQAHRRRSDVPLAVIHFDAHCDTWTDHFGEPSGHGTWVYEAIQAGLVDPRCFVQIGIRSPGQRAAREYVRDQGGLIFAARELRGLDGPAQLSPVVRAIHERHRQAGRPPVYLSLDIDCLDPAFAPGTGTPEPGGLSTTQVLTLIEELAPLPFVGMDCVEVAPAYDHAEITAQAAAILVWTYLCGQIHRSEAEPA
jgi:agmatinase